MTRPAGSGYQLHVLALSEGGKNMTSRYKYQTSPIGDWSRYSLGEGEALFILMA